MRSGWYRTGLEILGLAALYFGVAWAGLQFATVGDQVTLLWAPAGIALAAVLLMGHRVVPGIALGALLGNASTGPPLLFSCLVAAGNTTAAVAAAWLIRRTGASDGHLRTPRDAMAFVGCGVVVGACVSASLGATAMATSGLTPWSAWRSTWAEWWIGDAMGILVIAPPLLAWSSRPTLPTSAERTEVVAVGGALLVVGLVVFFQQPGGVPYPLAFAPLPMTIWAAYRFETFGASVASLLLAGIAIAGTASGYGPFTRETLSESVRLMWGFVGIVAVMGLTLGSQVAVRARAERALRASRDRLRREIQQRERIEEGLRRSERLTSLGTFAAGLAHEINNPLGVILLAAHAARDDLDRSEPVAGALDDIIEETERSARIVRSVLKFSKAEAAELSDLDLQEPLCRACDHSQQLGIRQSVRIDLEPSDPSLPVHGNAVELEQVFSNLLRNAIEASAPGDAVTVRARHEPGHVQVSIRDRGRGMSSDQQARAFEPFYTTRNGEGGTGLGLSLCHGIVEAHRGSLELASSPGKGTTIVVDLPCACEAGRHDGSHPRR